MSAAEQRPTLSAVHGSELEQLIMGAVEEGGEELLSILLLALLGHLGHSPGYLLGHRQLLAYTLQHVDFKPLYLFGP